MVDKFQEAVDYFFTQLSDDLLIPLVRVNFEFLSEAAKSERIKQRQARRFDSIRQFLRWLLTEARMAGDIRDDIDLDATVDVMTALNEGIVLLTVAGLGQVSLERLKAAYVATLNRGLSQSDHSAFPFAAEALAPATSSR